ncbi:hypothetical protein RZ533_26835 [Sphingobium yanoikuyae]|nr:hypothetical protein [Sphingobium yanoikuyae]MDV3482746.1 hypothetical protein [Sphingobium yanoikuyae]
MRLSDAGQWQNSTYDGSNEIAFREVGKQIKLASILTCENEVICGVFAPCLDKVLRLWNGDCQDFRVRPGG